MEIKNRQNPRKIKGFSDFCLMELVTGIGPVTPTLPTHEPLLQTCAYTQKPPINTSPFASIYYLGTKNFKITVSYCTYSHFFSIFEWSKTG